MEWVNLIATIITSGVIITLVEFFAYRRFNKAIKKNEADSGDLDNQMKSINLGQTFLERIQSVNDAQQKLQEQQKKIWEEQDAKRDEQWSSQNKMMNSILHELGELKNDVCNIKEFLDGDFNLFVENKKNTRKKKTQKVEKTK